ncbi:MAG: peptidylprolyl isomerase, partial [Candidatus Woesearchaeota archaeon]
MIEKKKDISKKIRKKTLKTREGTDDPIIVSYREPTIITEEPIDSNGEENTIKIEEIKEEPTPMESDLNQRHHTRSNPEPHFSNSTDPDRRNDDMEKESKSGLYIWLSIIVILALIVVIINLDKIIPGQESVVDGDIVASINGEEISKADLDKFYDLSVPELLKSSITKEVFLKRSMIPQTVMLQEAKNSGYDVSDDEIDKEIENLAETSGQTKDELLQQLSEQGISEEDVKLIYKNKILIEKLLDGTLFKDQEIQLPEIVRASHILVDTEDEAKEIKNELDKGASFEELAQQKSKDSSAVRGGDLGYFPRGRMVPEFEGAAFSLETGEVSGLVKSDFGYHIIKVTDKVEEITSKISDIDNPVHKQIAINQQADAIQTFTDVLVEKADVQIFLGEEDNVEITTTTEITMDTIGLISLGDCLAEKGIIIYGAEWSPFISEQKEILGDDFDKVDYIICSANSDDKEQIKECEDAGVEVYPTWSINGVLVKGVQSLEEL